MDGLNSDSFCLQDLVPSSSTSDRSAHPSARPETGDSFSDQQAAVQAANSAYRFSAMQPFPCPPTGHFMSQPVQPLPLPYPQVSHIPTSVHSYHQHHQSPAGFNAMNGSLRPSAHHFSSPESETTNEYFDKNQQAVCSLSKNLSDDKRKGESQSACIDFSMR